MIRGIAWSIGTVFLYAILLFAVGAGAEPTSDNGRMIFPAEAEETGSQPGETLEDSDAPPIGESDTQVEVEKLSEEKLSAYEENLEKLREQIFKSKSRLMQLYEQLKIGSVSIVGISILHTHEVGSTFKLESITYTLDGFEVYSAVNDQEDSLEKLNQTPVYEGSLLPGDHLLVVDMVFRGKGYGIFSYLNQYLFKSKSRYSFNVEEGDVVTLKVTSFDEGRFLTPLKERLKVRFEKE